MRKIELGFRMVIRSWVKHGKMLVKARSVKMALATYGREWTNNIRPDIERYHKSGVLTSKERKRLFAYAKKGKRAIENYNKER